MINSCYLKVWLSAALASRHPNCEFDQLLRHMGKFKFSKLLCMSLVWMHSKIREKKLMYSKSKHLYQGMCLICKDFQDFHRHAVQRDDVTSHWEPVKVNIKVKWTLPAKSHLEEDENHFGKRKTFLLRIAANKEFQVWFQKLFKISLKQLFLEVPFSIVPWGFKIFLQ